MGYVGNVLWFVSKVCGVIFGECRDIFTVSVFQYHFIIKNEIFAAQYIIHRNAKQFGTFQVL